MYLKLILLILSWLFIGCAGSNPLSLPKKNNIQTIGKIISLKNNETITYDALIKELSAYDIILIGEKHNNPYHHIAESDILKSLMMIIPTGGVVLEMLPVNTQQKIDALKKKVLKGKNIPADDISTLIDWDKKWNYQDYKNIVYTALYSTYTLLAGNLTQQEIKTILKGAKPLQGYASTDKKVQEGLKKIIQDTHQIPENLLENMVQAQQFKDRRMAEMLLLNPFSILIAGNYHINKTLGVPLHLSDLNSNKNIATLMLLEDNNNTPDDIPKYNQADFIWILPTKNKEK